MLASPQLVRRLRAAIDPRGFSVSPVDVAAFERILGGPTNVSVVLDPLLLPPESVDRVIEALQRVPRRAAVYAQLTPGGVHAALAFARDTSAAVLFQSGEEDFQSLVNTVLSGLHPKDAAYVLTGIGAELDRLPPDVRRSIVELFSADAQRETPTSLARRAALSRRSLDRWVDRAGLTSARRLVAVPPLLRAMNLIWDTILPLHRIAEICGYASVRRLHDHARELTGLEPAAMRDLADTTTILDRIVASLRADRRDRAEPQRDDMPSDDRHDDNRWADGAVRVGRGDDHRSHNSGELWR